MLDEKGHHIPNPKITKAVIFAAFRSGYGSNNCTHVDRFNIYVGSDYNSIKIYLLSRDTGSENSDKEKKDSVDRVLIYGYDDEARGTHWIHVGKWITDLETITFERYSEQKFKSEMSNISYILKKCYNEAVRQYKEQEILDSY